MLLVLQVFYSSPISLQIVVYVGVVKFCLLELLSKISEVNERSPREFKRNVKTHIKRSMSSLFVAQMLVSGLKIVFCFGDPTRNFRLDQYARKKYKIPKKSIAKAEEEDMGDES